VVTRRTECARLDPTMTSFRLGLVALVGPAQVWDCDDEVAAAVRAEAGDDSAKIKAALLERGVTPVLQLACTIARPGRLDCTAYEPDPDGGLMVVARTNPEGAVPDAVDSDLQAVFDRLFTRR
jgi:hypothetical protein